jgi:Ssp1 endopeptidase immunity protein Rap1a
VRQVRDVVVQYLKDHPEQRRYLAHPVVVTALNQAFACKKDEARK